MKDSFNQKIAVVGIGSLFPDANNTEEFWKNIISKKVSIRELPESLFESEIYYRPELRTAFNKQNKSITNIAGYIEDIDFNTVRKFKIPPSVAEHMDPNQHAALYTADQALNEINLESISREKISVIYGNGSVGTRYGDAIVSVQYDKIKHYLRKHPLFNGIPEKDQEELFEYVRANALKESIPITEDSAPGILPNIIAARISNVFGFNGPSYTIDAACASALTAIISGIKGLRLNEFDVAVCGGSDMPIKSLGLIFFSAINALSPDGSFPFDARANGFVMGQGSGTVVLKRLEDAVRNNDKIYAVINGYGEASDGKGKYIAAPNSDWQAYSIVKACEMAGYSADTIELIEAHGTGTTVGDVVELDGLKKAFKTLGVTKKNYCGVTSVKSNIGHLKSAAGIAGLIKTVLSLHHKKLPATANIQKINPKLELENSPFYILDKSTDWKASSNHPRRANVSAFGFGGADYHLALEEYRIDDYKSNNFSIASAKLKKQINIKQRQPNTSDLNDTSDVLYFSDDSYDKLLISIESFERNFNNQKKLNYSEYLKLHNLNTSSEKFHRAALVVNSFSDLKNKFHFLKTNYGNISTEVLQAKGIYYKESVPIKQEETAILFPGQAAQYANMLKDLKDISEIFNNVFDEADAFWLSKYSHTVSSLIYGKESNIDSLNESLKQTQNTHPAVFVSSIALFHYLKSLGLKSKYMIGHSLGEITALAASGKITFNDALNLIGARGYSFVEANLKDNGKMISVSKNYSDCSVLIEKSKISNISIANVNSNNQTIIAGNSSDVEKFKDFLKRKKVPCRILFVSHAFHANLMNPVSESFAKRINHIKFHKSDVNVLMNYTGKYYSNTSSGLKNIHQKLAEQIIEPVNFVRSIEKMKNEGVKLFVEVGPNSILSSLTKNILEGEKVTVIASDSKNSNSIKSLQKLNASLFVEGINLKPISQIRQTQFEVNDEKPLDNIKRLNVVGFNNNNRSVVYSGVSIGLPGSYKEMFNEDNFDQVFEGRNFIERMTEEEKQRLVDLQITKLVKDEKGPVFKLLSTLDDVIQLAGKAGRIDVVNDYHIDENELKKMTKTISMGIGAAYEALKDAQIPLVQEFTKTSSGKYLPGKLALPKYMQEDTGVIFANGFPMVDPIIEEVSKHVGYNYGSKTSKELVEFYQSIIEKVEDEQAKNLLNNWFSLYYSRLNENINENSIYKFNYNFINQISSQANNRIAHLINAKGPNFQMNAACSSTSNAIAIAEDFIKTGRVNRMIVVGADDSTSKLNMPYLGAGFLSSGAATSEGDLYKAAVPFDIKRNGMIMSSGAVGIVLESKEEVRKRGISEICELLGSHSFNTANHPSQIDSQGFATELDKFITKVENKSNISRDDLANDLIYISHETYTPPRGGCSQTEAIALSETFKSEVSKIIIGNTKGMTGHAMGASLEEAIAAKSLQFGKIPPVVNLANKDPLLSDLNISTGGSHDKNYALRMSAGFGAQGNYILLKKVADGNNRINDKDKYQSWLDEISESENSSLNHKGRILVVESKSEEHELKDENITYIDTNILTGELSKSKLIDKDKFLNTLSELTNYPPEMLEDEMEFGADLGISSDGQKNISESLMKKYGIEKISIYYETTIGDLLKTILNESNPIENIEQEGDNRNEELEDFSINNELKNDVLKIFSEVTKYPEDMLDLDMEMEADLGIDTVKQATILSMIGEKYQIEQDDSLKLSDYPTIGHILKFVNDSSNIIETENELASKNFDDNASEVQRMVQLENIELNNVTSEVIKIFSEVTKYPEDMLELNMEMEADLGIDTVKQATILSILGEKYLLDQNADLRLSDYPTIGHIIELVKTNGKVFSGEEAKDLHVSNSERNIDAESAESNKNTDTELSRQVLQLKPSKLGKKNYWIKNKNALVIGNNKTAITEIKNILKDGGCKADTFKFLDIDSVENLQTKISKINKLKDVDIIIDTTLVGQTKNENLASSNKLDSQLFSKFKNRFIFFKKLISLDISLEKIMCVIPENGLFFNDDIPNELINPINGAISGFYKSLRKELNTTYVKVININSIIINGNKKLYRNILINELEKAGNGFEMVYSNSSRKVFAVEDEVCKTNSLLNITNEDTFLITGGANGVTFQIVKELLKKYDSNFILIGRTQFPSNIIKLVDLSEDQIEQLRKDIRNDLQKNNKKVTPKIVNDEFNRLKKSIEIFNNIKTLDESRVRYFSCDVTDYDSLKEVLLKLKQEKITITALIHGAGIDKSHYIRQKSFEEFNKVFDTKVKGAINLQRLLNLEKLKLVVALSSISGRFGNPAQSDYSAANNFLSYWIRNLSITNKNLRSFSFLTSGWQEYGMAWRNEFVRNGSEEMGLNLIEPNLAVNAFLDELNSEQVGGEIIIHKGLNGFIEEGLSNSGIERYPFLDRVTKKNGEMIRSYRMFSVKRDAMLDQHRLGDTPIMPAVGYSEIGAEYYSLQSKLHPQYLFKNITFENPFKLFKEKAREIYVEGKQLDDSLWYIEISSKFQPVHSEFTNLVTHSRINITDKVGQYDDMNPKKWDIKKENPMILPATESLMLIEGDGPKQRIILGPLYNDIVRDTNDKASVTIYKSSVIYPTRFPEEQLTNNKYPLKSLLVNPCFLDTLYQSCAAHLLVTRKRVYLPWSAEDLGIVDVPRQGGIYTCYAQLLEENNDIVKYRVTMLDENNEIRYFVRSIKFRKINL